MAADTFLLLKEDPFKGIDARSPENQIPAGYLRDALNIDVVQGIARGRAGYAGYAGNFPVRVVSVEYDNANDRICFTLDSAIELTTVNLLNVRSTPVVIYGRLSANIGAGPFTTTDSAKYYPSFFQEIRQAFLMGTNTLTVPGTTHGLGTSNLFVGVVESLSASNLSNRMIESDNVNIDEITFDVDIDYTNSTGADIPVFTFYAAHNTETGVNYVSPNTTVPTGTTGTITIPAATHQLANFNIVARVYKDNGTNRDVVDPESLTINTVNGTVTVSVENNSGASADYFVILSSAPATNFRTGALSGATYTITIPNPETAFIFPGIYVANGVLLEQVIPDQVEFDAAANTIEITFQNPGANSFTAYWEYADIRSTELCVEDSTLTASGTDDRPQLTIWGLDHTEIYGETPTGREGWANHIDSYRIAGESRIIGAQGGNLYSVQEFSEAGTTYLFGSALPSLFQRTASTTVLSPTLWETGTNPGRTRGYINGTALGDNWATCTAVSYDAAVAGGSTRYDLTIPALVLHDSTGAVLTTNNTNINAIFTVGDQLTADDMSYSRHNGVFDIVHVEAGIFPNIVSIWVDNPRITTGDWDDSGVSGAVGIFSDLVPLQAASPFIMDDVLVSDALVASQELTVISSSDTTPTNILVSGVVDTMTLQAGVQLVGRRTGSVIPLRDTDDTATVEDFVRGDIVFYSAEPTRPLRILYVNTQSDVTGSTVTGDGTTATVTVSSGDTNHLIAGMSVLLTRAGVYTGEVLITDVPSLTTFTFDSVETDTVSTAVVVGKTIHIGEPITWEDTTSDTNTVQVDRRLVPVEAPDDNYTLTPSTHVRYFDANPFGDQPFLRSSMVADTMFFTDSDDEVMKFDGTSLFRAGLFKWQPGAFIQTDIAPAAKIVTSLRSVSYSAIDATKGRLTVAALDDLDVLPIGTGVRLTGSTETYTLTKVSTSATAPFYLFLDRALDSGVAASGSVSERATFKYYYRLNAVDQNNNVIASAVAQSEDYTVTLTQDAAVYHKLTGFPAWDNYDYDAIYVQAYRTKANTSAPFYRVFQQRLPFNGADGYVEFTDTFRDSNLLDLDPINTALKGQELGVGWQEPLRAKCITSAAGTTILGNIRDYSQIDLQLFGDSTVTAAQLNGTILEFRKDLTDVTATTNMVDRARYELVSGAVNSTITGITGSAGVSFTVASAAHGLVAGNWVYIYWNTASTPSSTARPITYSGWWQVFSVTAGSFTVKYTGSGAGAAVTFPTRFVRAANNAFDIPVLVGDPTANPDGNSSAANANTTLQLFQAGRRLALAVNASMRMADTTLTSPNQSAFTPWMIAIGGNDTGVSGRVLIRQPRVDTDSFGLKLDVLGTNFRVFVNNVERTAGTVVGSEVELFPSRILVGYENFPEIFDNPTAVLDSDSDSAIDINPSDGQEVTVIVPFFGEAAFGAAQQSAVVVVFKENSIYLVDVNEKRAGRNPVQRIETEGIGCTAPNSVSVTKNGIMFANESGMYALRRNLEVEYIGKLMERQWDRVDQTQLDLVQGHHYTVGRKYKVSVPIVGDTRTSEVFVYDHTNEVENGIGAWTRYDAHPSTGWCNLNQDAFFSSSTGRIFVIRRMGNEIDYQDDHSAIDCRLQLRANDFGQSGYRKLIDQITINYRTAVPSNAQVGTSVDTEQEYRPVTGATIVVPGTNVNGMSDSVGRDVLTVAHTTDRRKGVSMSVQIESSVRLETIEVSTVEFRVSSLGNGGVLQAVETER